MDNDTIIAAPEAGLTLDPNAGRSRLRWWLKYRKPGTRLMVFSAASTR